MRKKHPIRNFFLLLLLAALVAGLAALPLLTANQGEDENKASILSASPERRTLTKAIYSGAPLSAQESEAVRIPKDVKVTEYLVSNGDIVHEGDPVARVDDVSVMTAVKAVQDSLNELGSKLQTARGKITPGLITVDAENRLCVDGKQIEQSKLSYYTQFLTLSQQHREYEELLLELFKLHQDGIALAPCDGTVSGVDKTQVLDLSASGAGKLVFLALNTPDGDDNEVYRCYVKVIVGTSEDGSWQVRTGTTPSIVTDFLNVQDVNLTVGEAVDLSEPETVFAYSGDEWILAEPQVGDILLYAYASDNSYWVIRIGNVPVESDPEDSTVPTEPPTEPTEPTEEDAENPTEPTSPQIPDINQGGSRPGGGGNIDWSQISGMISGGGGGSRGGSSGGTKQETALYSTDHSTLCTVTPMETMCLLLSIDEMDISSLTVGMDADITLEALPNEHFAGKVTEISKFGINSGGSSKFTVTVELPCGEKMLPGMNANVMIPLETIENCLTIPVAALVEQGSRTVVFTGYDEKTKELQNPVQLELGFSDGDRVQILFGLSEGTSFYYSYYDVLEISTAVETRGMFG